MNVTPFSHDGRGRVRAAVNVDWKKVVHYYDDRVPFTKICFINEIQNDALAFEIAIYFHSKSLICSRRKVTKAFARIIERIVLILLQQHDP